MFAASPEAKPPHGPSAVRANEYGPPACGIAAASSASE